MRYQQKLQCISRLPIPDAPTAQRDAIGALAMEITVEAKARYQIHRQAQRRILSDLGAPGGALNQKLTAWWNLDVPRFRAEIQKVFRRDIPLKDRDAWDEWLTLRRAEHQQRTAAIVAGEVELNRCVYQLFDLSPAEIAIMEIARKTQEL